MSSLCNFYNPLGRQRFKRHKQISDTTAPIFIINDFWAPWFGRNMSFFYKLAVYFIHAHNGTQWFVGLAVGLQYVFHASYEFRACLRNAPFFFCYGLSSFFKSVLNRRVGDTAHHLQVYRFIRNKLQCPALASFRRIGAGNKRGYALPFCHLPSGAGWFALFARAPLPDRLSQNAWRFGL